MMTRGAEKVGLCECIPRNFTLLWWSDSAVKHCCDLVSILTLFGGEWSTAWPRGFWAPYCQAQTASAVRLLPWPQLGCDYSWQTALNGLNDFRMDMRSHYQDCRTFWPRQENGEYYVRCRLKMLRHSIKQIPLRHSSRGNFAVHSYLLHISHRPLGYKRRWNSANVDIALHLAWYTGAKCSQCTARIVSVRCTYNVLPRQWSAASVQTYLGWKMPHKQLSH